MAEAPKDDPMAVLTADSINDLYRKGSITAGEKNKLLRKKAEHNLTSIVKDEGAFSAVVTQTIKIAQENWDTLKEISATKPEDISAIQDAKNGARAAWAMIQIAAAPFAAIGEVSGNKAEQYAMSKGASPGLAKTIGIAVDVGTGFLPVGGMVRQFGKAVQNKAVGAVATAATKVADDAAKVAKKSADNIIEDAINKGLATDGLPLFEEAGRIVKPLDPKYEFISNLKTYKKEMDAITATKGHEQTLREANKLGITLEDVQRLTPGTALKESEMAAHLKALDGPVDDLMLTAKDVIKGKTEGVQLGKKLQDFFEYSPKFRGAEVTSGRAVEILKVSPPMKPLTNLMNAWDPESMAKLSPEQVWQNVAEDLLALGEKPGALKQLQVSGGAEVAEKGWKENTWPMIREAYTNLLLARPVTSARAVIGNTMSAMTTTIEREVAGWLSISDKGAVKGSGIAQFQGMMGGIGRGLSAYAKAFSTTGGQTRLDFPLHQIKGPLGRIINLPGDNMRGIDNFFKEILKSGDIEAQAIEQAHRLGLKGFDRADYIARRSTMPTSDMLEHADAFANYGTFMNDLGTVGKHVQGALQAGPLALWFPFMKTPMNLTKFALERTPGLNLVSRTLLKDIKAGGLAADMAMARLTMSSMTGMFLYGMAQQGMITGGGPAEGPLKQSWLGTKQPYSILGSEGWHQYGNLDPATTPVAMIADFAEIHNQLDDPTAEQTATAITLALTRDVVDKTWWQTFGQLSDIFQAQRSGQEVGSRALRAIASPLLAVTTGGPIEGAITRIQDPIQREARGLIDFWRQRTPGYSSTLPYKPDGYGDPILPPQTIGGPWASMVSPFTHKPEQTDRVKKEGERLKVRLPHFSWTMGGGQSQDAFDATEPLPGEKLPVELDEKQFSRRVELFRNTLRSPEYGIEKQVLDNPDYAGASWAKQRELFQSYISIAHKNANNMLLAEDKGLVEKMARARAAAALPLANPMDQEQAGAQFEEQLQTSLDLFQQMTPEESDNLLKFGSIGEPAPAQ
jgi:hypothetical protein